MNQKPESLRIGFNCSINFSLINIPGEGVIVMDLLSQVKEAGSSINCYKKFVVKNT